MSKSNYRPSLLSLSLDRSAGATLQAQLAEEIRAMVHSGRLEPGDRLPPSRALAADLGVSRITVTSAFDQLTGEGYLEGRRGSGVFVARDLSGLTLPPRPDHGGGPAPLPGPEPVRPFDPIAPDLAGFPHRDWARLMEQVWRNPEPALLSRADPLGWGPLREAIAAHLRDWRGISCDPAQVVVTSGLAEAIDLIAGAMLSPGDTIAVEEPGHRALRNAIAANRLCCHPVEVDDDGLPADRVPADARAVVVTPSRQFPLGMTMPLSRRLQLLDWAEAAGGIVIEDDYDGEYRYRGRPLPALTSLAGRGRVIYVGSFSKVMFTGLRLGFAVLPRDRLDAVAAAAARIGPRSSILAQPALARFIRDGQFATHLRRMRRLYAHRQGVLLAAMERHCSDLLSAEPAPAGMQLVARLSPGLARRMNDSEAARRARAAGVTTPALSAFFAGPPTRQGLVLGFAGFDDGAIDAAAARLGRALRG